MEKELTILTWPSYINPLTLDIFRSSFGVRIRLEVINSAEELIQRMHVLGPAPDVLIPPSSAVRSLNAEHRLLPLDHSHLPNFKNIEPRFQSGRLHDPTSSVSIIKDWGTDGIIYRPDKITERLQSWADFWKLACSAKYSGRATVLDAPGEVIGAALRLRGHSYDPADGEALRQARTDLLKLKPHLYAFETNYRPLILAGEVWLALGWNGDAARLNEAGTRVQYVIPTEGSQFWEDDWAIAADAQHPEAAHAFLNFVMRPDIAVQEARYTRYATGNTAALALLRSMRNDETIYPPPEVLAKLEPGLFLDIEDNRPLADLWQEIRG